MVYKDMTSLSSFTELTDRDLLDEVKRLACVERRATAELIASLSEVDARRLYLGEGCSSLFTYCTHVLHLSEHAAYGRIEAARAARRFPAILDMLTDGALTLTSVTLLSGHLTAENHLRVLDAARHKSKREVELIVAGLRPLPDVTSVVRKIRAGPLVTSTPALPVEGAPVGPVQPPALVTERSAEPVVIVPLTPDRYKLQVTISREAHDLLRRAQDLLRHTVPNGDPSAIVERALARLVDDLERRRFAAVQHPRSAGQPRRGSRHVPAAVKSEVWRRDEGRCAFVGGAGRCAERGFLELHHVIPFAEGGATDVANLQLRCRAHNAYEAEQWFGPLVVREVSELYDVTWSGPR